VILRLRDTHPDRIVELLGTVLPGLEDTLRAGAILVLEDAAARVRNLPV
jgi:hypothetical protein